MALKDWIGKHGKCFRASVYGNVREFLGPYHPQPGSDWGVIMKEVEDPETKEKFAQMVPIDYDDLNVENPGFGGWARNARLLMSAMRFDVNTFSTGEEYLEVVNLDDLDVEFKRDDGDNFELQQWRVYKYLVHDFKGKAIFIYDDRLIWKRLNAPGFEYSDWAWSL